MKTQFPIMIRIAYDNTILCCDCPEDIPVGLAFTVLFTSTDHEQEQM